MQDIKSLSGFFELANTRLTVTDLGKQMQSINPKGFAQMELGNQAYPYPFMNHAHLAILAWHPDNKAQHSIWFFKIPLDEQGFISLVEHQDLVIRVIKALQADQAERERLLSDHPYHFKPNTAAMACFNAYAGQILGMKPSQFYAPAKQFLLEDQPVDWQEVGLQGFADVCLRLNDKTSAILADKIPTIEKMPLVGLCHCLEHAKSSPLVQDALIQRLLNCEDNELKAALIRSLSQFNQEEAVIEYLQTQINQLQTLDLECLIAISTRCPSALNDDITMINFFYQLSKLANAEGIDQIVKDLVTQKGLRDKVLMAIRMPISQG